MPPRRPVVKCAANRIRCPDPTCGHMQRFPHIAEGKLRGRMVGACDACGTPYFLHSADGGAEVVGLWPGEADAINIDRPLPEIWKQLGLMDPAA